MNKSEKTAITSITGIIMIVILAIATSCSTMQTGVKKKFNGKLMTNVHHHDSCPAYH